MMHLNGKYLNIVLDELLFDKFTRRFRNQKSSDLNFNENLP